MNSRRAWLASLCAFAGLILSLCAAMAPAQAATPPTDLHGVSRTQVRIQMAWTATDGATHFQLRYATRSDFSDGRVVKPIASTSYTLTGLKPGTLYYFRVGSTDASGNATSGWSATATYPTRPLMKISVGTYNIKDPDSTAQGPWTTRGPRSAAAIIGQGVQLLGVQEVFEDEDRTSMLNYINQKSGGANYQMVPSPTSNDGEDSRVVFDTRRFTLKASGGHSFSYQNGSEDRAWAWAWLEHKTSLRNVLFVTTHLSPRSDTADVKQWSQLLTWTKNKVADLPVSPYVIITGDFNTTKFEPPATMLDVSRRKYGYEDVLGQIKGNYSTYRNPAQRVDAWISSSNRGIRDVREYSVATNRNSNSIDYIFVSRALKVPYYRVYAQPRHGYTMDYLASDHFLVRAIVSQ